MKGGPMGHGHGRAAMGERANDFKGTMKQLIKYISKYKVSIIAVLLFAIGSTVFSIVGPKILGKATTKIFEGLMAKVSGTGGIDFGAIEKILLLLVGLYIVSALFSFIQGYIMSGISQRISYEMRNQISEKINRMPMKYFDTKTHGEILSRITNDVDTLGMSLNQSITQLITSVTTMVGVLIMMISISWIMTLAALVIIPLSLFAVRKVVGRSQKYFEKRQRFLGHVNGLVEENYGGASG